VSSSPEDNIREMYGDVSLESAPVDPENPTFNSLLGALKAVHTGEMEMAVLEKYHEGLSKQLEQSIKNIESMEIPEGYKEITEEQMRLSRGSLDMVQMMLDHMEKYIDEPCMENMAPCVQLHMDCQSVMRQLTQLLDENIRIGEIAEKEMKPVD